MFGPSYLNIFREKALHVFVRKDNDIKISSGTLRPLSVVDPRWTLYVSLEVGKVTPRCISTLTVFMIPSQHNSMANKFEPLPRTL